MPERIQLRRTKGWRMPPNTVKVDRSTRWGNPFNFKGSDHCWIALSFGCRGDAAGRQEASVKAFREWVSDKSGRRVISWELQPSLKSGDRSLPLGPKVEAGEAPSRDDIREVLGGKNLACWCRPGQPCHADVLLEIANAADPDLDRFLTQAPE